jgi:adenylyltransferase/sulfurtransferase
MNERLTRDEQLRYSRHLMLPEVGEQGQLRLRDSSVLLVGAGALGSPTALYLAAAGVGRLGIADPDVVDLTNLHRQILHGSSSVGRTKLESATARLHETNPHVVVEPHPLRLTPDNALDIISRYDVVIDGSDNFPTRFLTNDAAFLLRKPLVHGAIHRFEGQSAVFAPHLGGPCYRCLLPELPAPGSVPSCAEAGVLGVLPGIIGSISAMEAIKLLLGIGTPPLGRLTVYDALNSRFRSLSIDRDSRCSLCGDSPTLTTIDNPQTRAADCCASRSAELASITVDALASRLAQGFGGLLLDVREPGEHAIARIEGAKLVPLATLADQLDAWPKDREILVHCKSGARSAKACRLLLDHGFIRVLNVEGGIDAWISAGHAQ